MAETSVIRASRATLKRLPLYLHLVEGLLSQGVVTVSSARIAAEFDFEPTQVRKDLETAGAVGTARVGFRVAALTEQIRRCLGWDGIREAVLIGAGNLGKALLGYRDFDNYGLKIVAAFDSDSRKVGNKVFGREIMAMDRMPAFIRSRGVRIGVVTVPAEHAQSAVDALVGAGIGAIWNFAPAPLRIPQGIILENARFTRSLAVLTNKLTLMDRERKGARA